MQGQACVPTTETIISVAAQTHHRLANCLRLTNQALERLQEQEPANSKDPLCKEPEGSSLEGVAEGCRRLAGQVEDNITRILDVIGERMPVPAPTIPGQPVSAQTFVARNR